MARTTYIECVEGILRECSQNAAIAFIYGDTDSEHDRAHRQGLILDDNRTMRA